jgi:ligand-binding sensor domain-containing protein/CBS domain-containing protein
LRPNPFLIFLFCIAISVWPTLFTSRAVATYTPQAINPDVPFFSQTALRDQKTNDGRLLTLGNDSAVPLWEFGCGVASLAMVFRYYGVDTDIVRLNEALRQTGGFSGALLAWDRPDAFRKAVQPWIQGIERVRTTRPQDYRQRVDDELAADHPVITYLGGKHYVVLVGKDERGNYRINDPWQLAEADGKDIPLEENSLKLQFGNINQFVFIYPDRNAPTNGIAVSGPIAEKYFALGGSKSSLGNPSAAEGSLAGRGRWQRFERGAILSASQRTFALHGLVWEKFQAEGGVSKLGLPRGDIYSYFVGPAVVWRADFANVAILWTEGARSARLLKAENAVRAEYFDNPNLSGAPVYTRFEEDTLFDWQKGAPGPWLQPDGFSARYTSAIEVGFPLGWGHNFVVDVDEGVRVKLDGETVLDAWTSGAKTHKFSRHLGGGKHTLVVEYREVSDAARLQAAWSAWPANPVFATEGIVGPYEQLPASVTASVPDLATPMARATTTAQAVRAVMTAEARITPTPDASVMDAARQSFEAWAQRQGEPYRDAQVAVMGNDGYFAQVRVTAWFRPDQAAPWEEREASVECRQVGGAWQCDQRFAFRLTEGEQARRAEATRVAVTQATATAQARATDVAMAQATSAAQAALTGIPKVHLEWTSYTNGNDVRDLLVQGDFVWAATSGGVVRWDVRAERYVKFTAEHGLAGNFVHAIAAGPNGEMWFGTDGGVSRLTPDGRWHTFTTQDGLAGNSVRAIAAGPNGEMWFGTDGGVSHLMPDGRWRTFTTQDGLASNSVSTISVGQGGALWFGFTTDINGADTEKYHGVSRFTPDGVWRNFTMQDGLAGNNVVAIAGGIDGAMWFGTLGGGVSRFTSDGRWRTFNAQDGLAHNSASTIAVGLDGTMWFGLSLDQPFEGNGVSRLTPDGRWRTFTTQDGLASNDVRAIAIGSDGSVWFAPDASGLNRLTADGNWHTFTTQDSLSSNRITAIAVGSERSMWFGTWDRSVNRLETNGRWHFYDLQDGQVGHSVQDITVGTDGALWFSRPLVPRVSRLTPNGRLRTFAQEDGLVTKEITAIGVGADGSMWFGTWDNGLSRLGPDGVWRTLTIQNGQNEPTGKHVSAIAAAADGSMWFGTGGNGVSRLSSDGSWHTFTTQHGLASNNIRAITVGPDGAVWFGTDRGVGRLGSDGVWRTYTTQEGLADKDVRAIVVGPDGAMWFGTDAGRADWARTGDGRPLPLGTAWRRITSGPSRSRQTGRCGLGLKVV